MEGKGWGEAAPVPPTRFVPVIDAHQLVRGETDFLPAVPDCAAAYTNTNNQFLADPTKDAKWLVINNCRLQRHDYFRIMAATGHKTMTVFKR